MSCQNFEMDSRRTYRFLLWKIWKKLKKKSFNQGQFVSEFLQEVGGDGEI